MKKIAFFLLICLFIQLNVFAQAAAKPSARSSTETQTETDSDKPYYVFTDYFSDNTNNWSIKDTADMMSKIENGVLTFGHKRNESGYYLWNWSYLDGDYDFTIETSIKHVSGVDSYGYGLTWGMEDIDNYYCFDITQNGYFRVAKHQKGEWYEYLGWTSTNHVKYYDYNKLTVKRIGNLLKFYINDSYVHEMPYQAFFGDGVGYDIWRNQTIAVDYLTVYGVEDWDLWWDLWDW